MSVDMKKMRRSYDENQRGGDLLTFDKGLTLLYIHGMCRDNDEHEPTQGLNHAPIVVHFGLGKDRAMSVCLDVERNPIIAHPFVKAILKKRKVALKGGCPVCKGIKSGTIDDDTANEAAPQTRFVWGVTPIAYKPKASSAKWTKLTPKPSVAMVGSTVYNGFMDMFFENGDITDVGEAIFVQVKREGKGRFDTKYEVKIDPRTLKSPQALPAPLRRALAKAMDVEGDCDVFKIIGNMIKDQAAVKALLAGVKVDTSDGDDDEEYDGDEDSELEDGDEDSELEDGDEDSELEDEEEASEDSDDDDAEGEDDDDAEGEDDDDLMDEDEEDEEEDGPPPPKSKSKSTKKSKVAAPKAKASKSNGKAKAKPPVDDDDDDDDLGLDELDAELERANASKKRKKPSKSA